MAARQQRHPHDVHALPDRCRLRRPPGRRRRLPGRIGASWAAGLDRPRATGPRRPRRAGTAGRDHRPVRRRRSATRSVERRAKGATPARLGADGPAPSCCDPGSSMPRSRRPAPAVAPRALRSAGGACPALDARLDQPAGVPIGMPADIPAPLLQLEWCAPFAGVVRDALHALKYGGERRLAVPLGQAVARRWARAGAGGDLIVAVPVHAARARQRGYDQAVLIAEAAADALGLPFGRVLRAAARDRSRSSTSDRRATGPRTSRAPSVWLRRGETVALAGRWVVLVDDVMTTGSTLSACATVLLGAGAARRSPRSPSPASVDRPRPPPAYTRSPTTDDRRPPSEDPEVTCANDRQGQEHRHPGPRPRLRRAEAAAAGATAG